MMSEQDFQNELRRRGLSVVQEKTQGFFSGEDLTNLKSAQSFELLSLDLRRKLCQYARRKLETIGR